MRSRRIFYLLSSLILGSLIFENVLFASEDYLPNNPRSASILEEFSNEQSISVDHAKVAYHKAGQGPALVLIHGYPLSGLTWRKMIPELAQDFTCYAFDVIGFGGSDSSSDTDFSSQGQARIIARALDALGVLSFSLIGNDSGGWIARELALLDPQRVTKLILTNTEMPDHRPPFIPLYQRIAQLPYANLAFHRLLISSKWRRSGAGFGGVFQDRSLIDEEFGSLFLWPLLTDNHRIANALRFLRMMKFQRLDNFRQLHRELTMPVLLLWGDSDPTFPLGVAREAVRQFPNAKLAIIHGGKLFMHEEYPYVNSVTKAVMQHLKSEL